MCADRGADKLAGAVGRPAKQGTHAKYAGPGSRSRVAPQDSVKSTPTTTESAADVEVAHVPWGAAVENEVVAADRLAREVKARVLPQLLARKLSLGLDGLPLGCSVEEAVEALGEEESRSEHVPPLMLPSTHSPTNTSLSL